MGVSVKSVPELIEHAKASSKPLTFASTGPVTVSTVAMAAVYVRLCRARPTLWGVPRSWIYSMVVLIAALLASMVIAAIKLI